MTDSLVQSVRVQNGILGLVADNVLKDGTRAETYPEEPANHTHARAATGLPRQDRHVRATAPSVRRATMGSISMELHAKPKSARAPAGLAPQAQLAPHTTPPSVRRAVLAGI